MTDSEVLEHLKAVHEYGQKVMGSDMRANMVRLRRVEAILVEVNTANPALGASVLVPVNPTMEQLGAALASASFTKAMLCLTSAERGRVMVAMKKELGL